MAGIVAVWHRSQDGIRSARINWEEACEQTVPPMVVPGVLKPEQEKLVKDRGDGPLKTRTISSFSFAGTRSRYSTKLLASKVDELLAGATENIAVMNDGMCRAWERRPIIEQTQGVLARGSNPDPQSLFFFPLLVNFTLFDAARSPLDVQSLSLRDETASKDGREFLVVEGKNDRFKRTFWIDPERDCSIVQVTVSSGERLSSKLENSYERDAAGAWRLKGWHLEHFNRKGKRSGSRTGTIKSLELNAKIPDSEFQFDFPAGTRVQDLTAQKLRMFIVLKNGEHRPYTVQEIERGATQADLLSTPAGQARLPGK